MGESFPSRPLSIDKIFHLVYAAQRAYKKRLTETSISKIYSVHKHVHTCSYQKKPKWAFLTEMFKKCSATF